MFVKRNFVTMRGILGNF